MVYTSKRTAVSIAQTAIHSGFSTTIKATENRMPAKHIPPLTLTLPAVPFAGASAPDPHALLERAKQAMGGEAWDDVTIIVSQFSVVTSGLEGTGVGVEDLHRGRYLNRYTLDTFSGAN